MPGTVGVPAEEMEGVARTARSRTGGAPRRRPEAAEPLLSLGEVLVADPGRQRRGAADLPGVGAEETDLGATPVQYHRGLTR